MSSQKSWFSKRLLPAVLILAKASKLAKAAKFLKIAKPMITLVTMSISAIAYAFWLGPWFAIGLVGMLFVHEMGHVVAMRMRGYDASAPVFIPFLGAVIFGPRMTCRDDEAFIGIGGPVLGSLAAAAVLTIWYFLPNKESDLAVILLMVSYVGMFLNVFNLVPIRPLDGGRVTQAVGSWFRYVGVAALAAASVLFQEPVILFIWILVLPEITVIPLRLRAVLGVLLWVAMVTLMAMGYSEQPFWVDVVDIVFAGMLVVMNGIMAYGDVDPAQEDDERPPLAPKDRMRWLAYYGGLTVVLLTLMFYQVQQLPVVG